MNTNDHHDEAGMKAYWRTHYFSRHQGLPGEPQTPKEEPVTPDERSFTEELLEIMKPVKPLLALLFVATLASAGTLPLVAAEAPAPVAVGSNISIPVSPSELRELKINPSAAEKSGTRIVINMDGSIDSVSVDAVTHIYIPPFVSQQAAAAKRYEWLKKYFALMMKQMSLPDSQNTYYLTFETYHSPSQEVLVGFFLRKSIGEGLPIIASARGATLEDAIDKAIAEKILEKAEQAAKEGSAK